MKAKGGRSPAKNDGSPTEEALARYVENPCTHTTTRRRRLVLYPIVAFPSFPPLSLERSFPYPLIVSILTRCRARRPRRPIPHPRITDFQPPHTVLRVDLSCQVGGDKLRSIGGLYSFTNLRDLNLSGNSITKVENLDHLVQLESLNLARNRIRRIEPTCGLEMFAKLRRLDLSGNFLQVRRRNRGARRERKERKGEEMRERGERERESVYLRLTWKGVGYFVCVCVCVVLLFPHRQQQTQTGEGRKRERERERGPSLPCTY